MRLSTNIKLGLAIVLFLNSVYSGYCYGICISRETLLSVSNIRVIEGLSNGDFSLQILTIYPSIRWKWWEWKWNYHYIYRKRCQCRGLFVRVKIKRLSLILSDLYWRFFWFIIIQCCIDLHDRSVLCCSSYLNSSVLDWDTVGEVNGLNPSISFFGYGIINFCWSYRYLGILQEVVVFDCSKFDLILLLNCVVYILVMNGFGRAIDEHIQVEVLTSVGHWSCLELNPLSIWYSNICIAWYLQSYSMFFYFFMMVYNS